MTWNLHVKRATELFTNARSLMIATVTWFDFFWVTFLGAFVCPSLASAAVLPNYCPNLDVDDFDASFLQCYGAGRKNLTVELPRYRTPPRPTLSAFSTWVRPQLPQTTRRTITAANRINRTICYQPWSNFAFPFALPNCFLFSQCFALLLFIMWLTWLLWGTVHLSCVCACSTIVRMIA